MRVLCSPSNEVELTLLKSLLDSEGIPYQVRSEFFSSSEVGPFISPFNIKTVLVREVDYDRAKRLLEVLKGSDFESPGA